MLSGARTTTASSSCSAISVRKRSSLSWSTGQLIGSPPFQRRRGHPMGLLPGDHRVAQHADSLDLALHHVPGLEVVVLRILAEAGYSGHRAQGQDVAGGVVER